MGHVTKPELYAALAAAVTEHNLKAHEFLLGIEPYMANGCIEGLVFVYHERRLTYATTPSDNAHRHSAWRQVFKSAGPIPYGAKIIEAK